MTRIVCTCLQLCVCVWLECEVMPRVNDTPFLFSHPLPLSNCEQYTHSIRWHFQSANVFFVFLYFFFPPNFILYKTWNDTLLCELTFKYILNSYQHPVTCPLPIPLLVSSFISDGFDKDFLKSPLPWCTNRTRNQQKRNIGN